MNQMDISQTKVLSINQDLAKNAGMFMEMTVNGGIVNIDGNSTKDSLVGEIKYLGIKPVFSYETNQDKLALITIKSSDQTGEQEDIHLSKQTNGRIDLGLGAGKVSVDLRELDIPFLNVGAGAGSIGVIFSKTKSTKATLIAGAGKLTLSIPKGVAVRIAFSKGVKFDDLKLGKRYEKNGEGYQTKDYEKAPVKIDVTVGQALGGFSINED